MKILYVGETLLRLGAIGRENAIISTKLCDYMGISGTDLRNAIHRERCNDIKICGDNMGYYIASNEKEVDMQYNRMLNRIIEMAKANQTFKKNDLEEETIEQL